MENNAFIKCSLRGTHPNGTRLRSSRERHPPFPPRAFTSFIARSRCHVKFQLPTATWERIRTTPHHTPTLFTTSLILKSFPDRLRMQQIFRLCLGWLQSSLALYTPPRTIPCNKDRPVSSFDGNLIQLPKLFTPNSTKFLQRKTMIPKRRYIRIRTSSFESCS